MNDGPVRGTGAIGPTVLATKPEGIDYSQAPKELVPCACCGSTRNVVAYVGDRYDFGLRTVVCEDCGLTFTNPRPTGEWFEAFYRLHYRTYYEDVANPDEEYLSRDRVRGRQSRNVQWLQSAGLPPEGRLLDVGSAEGTFLRLFEDGFPRWQAQGVEPSADFSAFARSHFGLRNVATARLEDLESWPSEQFDLLTINHVLEHLLNPDWFFSTARRMLKPGGHLFIDVPDAESESRGIGNLHIAHVYHFTMASLGNFLAKHGFEVVTSRKGTEKPQWTFQIMARKAPEVPEQWRPEGISAGSIVRSFRRYSGATLSGRIGTLTRRLSALTSKIPRGAQARAGEPVGRALPVSAVQPDPPAGSAPRRSDRARRILIIVPNKLRDLEGLALTGFHLSRCYGHDVRYTSGAHVVEALQASVPDLLVMDHLAWDYRAEQAALAKRMGARLVLLPTSGLFQDASDHELIVGRAFHASKLIDLLLSWGDEGRRILVEKGLMAASRIQTVGCPRFDFYQDPYISLIGPRAAFLERLGVAKHDAPVIVWTPANVASVAVGPEALARWEAGTNLDQAVFKQEMDDVQDQYREHTPLIVALARRRPDWTVIVKVHPSDQLSRFQWMGEQAPNIRVVHDVLIRELLYHCDVLLQRASTTANEAWLLGRPVLALATAREALKPSLAYAEGNETVRTLDEAVARIEAFLKDPVIPQAQLRAREAFIAKTYHRVDGRASERAARMIHEFACASGPANAASATSVTLPALERPGEGTVGVAGVLKGILGVSTDRSLRFWRRSHVRDGRDPREVVSLDADVETLYAQFARVHLTSCAPEVDVPRDREPPPGEGHPTE